MPHSADFPPDSGIFVGAGGWRKHFDGRGSGWPASWTMMERAKFLSSDATHLHKFEGLGHYGKQILERALVLSDGGFCPRPASELDDTGYLAYRVLASTPLTQSDISEHLLKTVAAYCAFRSHALASSDLKQCKQNLSNLELMLETNLSEEFGSSVGYSFRPLEVVKPVVADARMQLWEWGQMDGKFIKFDAASHGDDHFFPGPTDIAWDLAGAVVELSLGSGTEGSIAPALLRSYNRLSGDDASFRLPAYLLAYSAFRLGYCKMAAQAMRGSEEELGMQRQYLQYREFLARQLKRRAAA